MSTKQQCRLGGPLPLIPLQKRPFPAPGPEPSIQRGLLLSCPSAAASAASAASQSNILLPAPCSCSPAAGSAANCCVPAAVRAAAGWFALASALAVALPVPRALVPCSRWRIHRRMEER